MNINKEIVNQVSSLFNKKLKESDFINIYISKTTKVYRFEIKNKFYVIKTSKANKLINEANTYNFIESKLGKDFSCKILFYTNSFIILEYILNDGNINSYSFTNKLNQIHKIKSKSYEVGFKTSIADIKFNNNRQKTWWEFFFYEKLEVLLKKLKEKEYIKEEEYKKYHKKIKDSCKKYLIEPKEISLLHGDLWAGNILYNNSKAYLIDFCPFFGDLEFDYAYSSFYEGMPKSLYTKVKKMFKTKEELKRKNIYYIYYSIINTILYKEEYIKVFKSTLEII